MTIIEKLRTLARELAGEAWDYDRDNQDEKPATVLSNGK